MTRQTNTASTEWDQGASTEWDQGTNRQEEYKWAVHTTLLAQLKEHITLVTKRARG